MRCKNVSSLYRTVFIVIFRSIFVISYEMFYEIDFVKLFLLLNSTIDRSRRICHFPPHLRLLPY